jgi:hypothetical protein
MIELEGLSRRQCIIAECLWNQCHSEEDVRAVLNLFGRDAHIVYDMIVAHAMDQYMMTDEAMQVLERFMVR